MKRFVLTVIIRPFAFKNVEIYVFEKTKSTMAAGQWEEKSTHYFS